MTLVSAIVQQGEGYLDYNIAKTGDEFNDNFVAFELVELNKKDLDWVRKAEAEYKAAKLFLCQLYYAYKYKNEVK